MSTQIVNYHHEHSDGSGYPEGLMMAGIPLSAQIVSLVGAYCSLTEERLYRRAFNDNQAFEILGAEKDIKFNPELFDICRKISTQFI